MSLAFQFLKFGIPHMTQNSFINTLDEEDYCIDQPLSCLTLATFGPNVPLLFVVLYDRYLLHPTEGMGITDEGTRRQILEALDSLKE